MQLDCVWWKNINFEFFGYEQSNHQRSNGFNVRIWNEQTDEMNVCVFYRQKKNKNTCIVNDCNIDFCIFVCILNSIEPIIQIQVVYNSICLVLFFLIYINKLFFTYIYDFHRARADVATVRLVIIFSITNIRCIKCNVEYIHLKISIFYFISSSYVYWIQKIIIEHSNKIWKP